jgi:serine protease Do
LRAIKWGNSDDMDPGMTVIAIGNPLNFGFTVTHGIISAKNRDITETPLDNFLQIDAPINPGNSGGPLFNKEGEVIGMNTALYQVGDVGGSVGLNFAIPGNDVRFLYDQLMKYGRVRLGSSGAVVNNLNQDMADAVGLPKPEGVVIAYIPSGSPAAGSKLQIGDIILQVAGHDVANVRQLKLVNGALGAGDTVPFLVLRDGARLMIPVTLGEAADDNNPTNRLLIDAQPTPRTLRPDLGLTAEAITDENRPKYGIPKGIDGVVVTDVMINTMGADLGITPGDVVMRINATNIDSMVTLHAMPSQKRARPAATP